MSAAADGRDGKRANWVLGFLAADHFDVGFHMIKGRVGELVHCRDDII